ncbi:hypothetical protein Droror1_Dr00025485 [Drosera rotundifolia]
MQKLRCLLKQDFLDITDTVGTAGFQLQVLQERLRVATASPLSPGKVRRVPEAALRAALSSLAHPGASPFAAVRRLIPPEPDPSKPRPGEPLSTRCESVTSSAASAKLLVPDHRLTKSLSWGLPRSKSADHEEGIWCS